ncbi:MAG: DUF4112 domain-containing protein [Acidobacteria bacterium]|nr:DUF4112 domain-containing protein [Acidobacteriota bacterium]MBV9475696.1 DUF4112 domain-containing protein [Acidobacteriota bacterium]
MPKAIEPEVIEPDEKLPRDLVALRRFARLMDEAVAIPGTRFRFGLDAALGLIPGIGDLAAGILSTWIVVGALRHRVPARIILRMVFNIAFDIAIGAVPVAGDVFDFLFEENMKNMRLLERYRNRRRTPRTPFEIALVTVLIVAFLAAVVVVAFGALLALVFWLIGKRGPLL